MYNVSDWKKKKDSPVFVFLREFEVNLDLSGPGEASGWVLPRRQASNHSQFMQAPSVQFD